MYMYIKQYSNVGNTCLSLFAQALSYVLKSWFTDMFADVTNICVMHTLCAGNVTYSYTRDRL